MARPVVRLVSSTAVPTVKQQAQAAPGERKLRRVTAWLLLIFLIQGELGAVWDREWHAYVGRDQFFTPPHILIYSCVSGAGLLALAMVLWETRRYHRGVPGVDDQSTARIAWFFHAPLGFSVLGFGALAALAAAPLDNYWHEQYGVDIALWAPFHMMGVTGGLVGILGMIYVFASEATIERESGEPARRLFGLTALEIGAVMAMASFLNFVLTGFLQFPLFTIGTIHISTYPLPLVMGGACMMLAAVRFTRRPGAATLVILLLLLHTLLVEIFVPWAIRVMVVQDGYQYIDPNKVPYFSLSYALLPLLFLISSLIVDGVAYWQLKYQGKLDTSAKSMILLGLAITPSALVIAPFLLSSYSVYAPVFLPEPGVPYAVSTMVMAVLVGVVAGLTAGVLGTLLGGDFGDIWRWNRH